MLSFRRAKSPVAGVVDAEADARRALLLAGLRDLAGGTRGVVYDVPYADRPRATPGSIFLRDSAPWRRFLDTREAVDTGDPTLLLALRVLDDEERHLAVDWGTTYANTFLLIEPGDWRCDLTDPESIFGRRLEAAIAATERPDREPAGVGWTRSTPLGALLRHAFGVWRYWTLPWRPGATRRIALNLDGPGDTLWARLAPVLDERFPQAAFDRALVRLHASDRELLGGPVLRARSVFRTRLGLPVPHDARSVNGAVRRLVNAGGMRVVAPSRPGRPVFGAGRPVPADVSEDEFAQFLMV